MIELSQKEIAFVSGGVTAKEILKETSKIIKKCILVAVILGMGFCLGYVKAFKITNKNISISKATGGKSIVR